MANVYDENPEGPRIAQTYMQEFRGREIAGSESFAGSMQRERGVAASDNDPRIDMNTIRRTDLYNAILRPLGYDGFVRLVVREKDRPLGGLVLWRSPGESGFKAEDKRRLAGLEAFLAHALAVPAALDAPLVDSGRLGLIVANSAGKPVYSSAEGRRLLFLATHPKVEPSADVRRLVTLPPALVRLCRDLAKVFAGDPFATAPVQHHRNVWGGFTFRGHWLEGGRPRLGPRRHRHRLRRAPADQAHAEPRAPAAQPPPGASLPAHGDRLVL